MRRVSAADANRHVSKLMRAAMAGETVIVTDRGRPAVKIEAIRPAPGDEKPSEAFAAFLDELRSRPVLNGDRLTRDDFYD
ncbi:type II toxin-antitoxin system Phd/YefM family antitoxin [Salinarimonas soli]|uniref:Type II toxin-antitoxin system prevent-host-death family antitoxin n=1 Tax=Salinarimonas soli TaxID=1638099 RepID=A0A5B2VI83_9HYPH|nr:type II toxin-antitoxin system prevent-host-death family antitoxin [Salinarimonas soli]KAA2237897.1 type II toxin-antitoxin system prevent-host-death family antitoxin [Salinarimonas soli]